MESTWVKHDLASLASGYMCHCVSFFGASDCQPRMCFATDVFLPCFPTYLFTSITFTGSSALPKRWEDSCRFLISAFLRLNPQGIHLIPHGLLQLHTHSYGLTMVDGLSRPDVCA